MARQKVRLQQVELRKAAKGELTQAEIERILANFERLSKQEQQAFTRRVKRETGVDYEYMAGGRYVPPTKFGEPFAGSMLYGEESQTYTTKSRPSKFKYGKSTKYEERYDILKPKETEKPSPAPRPKYPTTPYITTPTKYTPPRYTPSRYPRPLQLRTPEPPYKPTKYKTPRTPKTPRIPSKPMRELEPKEILEEPKILVKGFYVYVKRRGKWRKVSGVFERSRAIEKGARVTKQTLAASFKIEEADQLLKLSQKEQRQIQLGREFRTYKVRKGRKLPQENLWIQRRPYRLGTRSERREIQQAKFNVHSKK